MTENAFYDSLLSYKDFDATIMNLLQHLAEDWLKYNRLPNYGYEDSDEVNKGFAIYKLMKDTIQLRLSSNNAYMLVPYKYDFNDFFGAKN